jgi:LAO/AO transport system kinase
MRQELSIKDYIKGIKEQDISILSRAITLIESKNPKHQALSRELLKEILPLTGKAKRISVSGTPGVGKSTFLENFGMFLIDKGFKIAALTIDPTSQITGGSILGDKTRMQDLSANINAFVRPSPNGSTLGGVAAKTREAMLLCDAFGFDFIFIETVGVGQSELTVSNIVDFFILLMQPGSGDELQGIKRGILEVSDLVIVNKSDGEFEKVSKIAQHDYKQSLQILQLHNSWQASVLRCSSLNRTGFDAVFDNINLFYESFFTEDSRNNQTQKWLKELVMEKFQAGLDEYKDFDRDLNSILNGSQDLLAVVDNIYNKIKSKK